MSEAFTVDAGTHSEDDREPEERGDYRNRDDHVGILLFGLGLEAWCRGRGVRGYWDERHRFLRRVKVKLFSSRKVW